MKSVWLLASVLPVVLGCCTLFAAACGADEPKPYGEVPGGSATEPAGSTTEPDSGATEPDGRGLEGRCQPSNGIPPDCTGESPNLECVEQMYCPLGRAEVPFDQERVALALGQNEFAVAPEWFLTAHHVLEANAAFPYRCFFEDYVYANNSVLEGPGCGSYLMAGGHPHTTTCKNSFVRMGKCVDQVPFSEAFDIILHRGERRSDFLQIASKPPAVGDRVYLVGWPSLSWLTEEERGSLELPVVSAGEILAVGGRGAIASAPASGGHSGGPLLNERGEVLGVAYTLVRHQRAEGTATPDDVSDDDVVIVMIDEVTRTLAEQSL